MPLSEHGSFGVDVVLDADLDLPQLASLLAQLADATPFALAKVSPEGEAWRCRFLPAITWRGSPQHADPAVYELLACIAARSLHWRQVEKIPVS